MLIVIIIVIIILENKASIFYSIISAGEMSSAEQTFGGNMYFQQITTPGLGCFSYIIGCPRAGVMAVADPRRDIDVYLAVAKERGMRITHIFDTHVHADHISGARELSRAGGADIYLHESAPVEYEVKKVKDGDQFKLGNAVLRVLHTPGHTPNSISLLVTDLARSEQPAMILTGDLLFVGDTGRPDLPGEKILDEQICNLYDSLHTILGSLPDFLEVYPAHGQGSLCGGGMSAKPSSTLGYERIANPRMRLKDFAEFRADILGNLPMRPQSFSHIIATNIKGASLLADKGAQFNALAPGQVEELQAEGAVILDLRSALSFASAHIPGAVNVDAAQPPSINWIGTVIAPGKPLVLVLRDDDEYSGRLTELRRIGYDDVRGYLKGGMGAWLAAGKDTGSVVHVPACALKERLAEPEPAVIIDVRGPEEYAQGHLEGAVHMPFDEILKGRCCVSDPDVERIVVCQSGYRAAIAASLLLAFGCRKVSVAAGGLNAVNKCREQPNT